MLKVFGKLFLAVLVILYGKFSYGQVINGYASVSLIAANTLIISNSNEVASTGTFTVGMEVIVMQMQDDVIGSNTGNNNSFGNVGSIGMAGMWEKATITAVTRSAGVVTSITVDNIINSYILGSNSSVQIITYPTLGTPNYSTTGNMSARAWNSTSKLGGVLAFNVAGTLTIGHSISANGAGFNGGVVSRNSAGGCDDGTYTTNNYNENHAGKGEGIYNSIGNFLYGRGHLINGGGGGNEHNAGGAGGGNFSAGGVGGPGWGPSGSCSPNAGGLGGVDLSSYISMSRFFMGGGGGGGQQNNNRAEPGASGGGIVMIHANTIKTTGTCTAAISANGNNSSNSSGNDGTGGAGAGGSILLDVANYDLNAACPLTIAANGGNGGNVTGTTATHGGGGGGGQGVIFSSVALPTTNVIATTNVGTGGLNSTAATATRAGGGAGSPNAGIFTNVGVTPLPLHFFNLTRELKSNQVLLKWKLEDVNDVSCFEVEKKVDNGNFVKIGTVKLNGNINGREFFFHDFDLNKENDVYYRIKMINSKLRFGYSNVVAINKVDIVDDFKDDVINNNPYDNKSIQLNLNGDKLYSINLIDMTGKNILQLSNQSNIINLSEYVNLNSGTYILQLVDDLNNLYIHKIVIF